MIRIALHEQAALESGNMHDELNRLAVEAGFMGAAISSFKSSIDLSDLIGAKGPNVMDIAVVPYDLPGMSGVDALAEARGLAPTLYSVLLAPTPGIAADAAAVGIQGFLLQPYTDQQFCEVLGRQMRQVAELHKRSFVLAGRSGTRRLCFCDVMYCETSGHDQIVHMSDGQTHSLRASSQMLFELLAGDKRFFKVGSSSIVNLDSVQEVRSSNGTVALVDGTILNVPVRVRKGLETALLG